MQKWNISQIREWLKKIFLEDELNWVWEQQAEINIKDNMLQKLGD